MKKLLIATVATLALGAMVGPAMAQATLAPAEWTSNGNTINDNSTITSTTTAESGGGTGRIVLTASNGATVACHLQVTTSDNSWVGDAGTDQIGVSDLMFSDCVSNLCPGVTASNNNTISSQLVYDTSTLDVFDQLSNISFTDSVPCVGSLTFTGSLKTVATHDANACGGIGGVILEFVNSVTGGTLSGPGGLTARAAGFQEVCLDDGTDLDVEIP